jgi:aspartyl-tRNA(Asn)/glutamyl-tRNA(Gln) amidotransferase subunit C
VLASAAAMAGPTIDGKLVRHVAMLASLSLSDAEAVRFAGELAKIVEYVAQLDALDTSGVTPTAHVQLDRMPLRADEPTPCLTHEEALAQAPRVEGEGFAVPAFVDEK